MKTGASALYGAGAKGANSLVSVTTSGASLAKSKMDETGITAGATMVGSSVYNFGATGASYIGSKIDENPTLASGKAAAAQGASQMA